MGGMSNMNKQKEMVQRMSKNMANNHNRTQSEA